MLTEYAWLQKFHSLKVALLVILDRSPSSKRYAQVSHFTVFPPFLLSSHGRTLPSVLNANLKRHRKRTLYAQSVLILPLPFTASFGLSIYLSMLATNRVLFFILISLLSGGYLVSKKTLMLLLIYKMIKV